MKSHKNTALRSKIHAYGMTVKRFDKIDADQNNSLSRDEVTQFIVALE